MKATEFRILGPELGEPDSYIDAVVDGIDGDGTIYFAEVNGKRKWSLSSERISTLMESNFMLESSNVVKHKLWERLDKLTADLKKGRVTSNFAVDSVADAQRALFQAAFEETR